MFVLVSREVEVLLVLAIFRTPLLTTVLPSWLSVPSKVSVPVPTLVMNVLRGATPLILPLKMQSTLFPPTT